MAEYDVENNPISGYDVKIRLNVGKNIGRDWLSDFGISSGKGEMDYMFKTLEGDFDQDSCRYDASF